MSRNSGPESEPDHSTIQHPSDTDTAHFLHKDGEIFTLFISTAQNYKSNKKSN